MRSAARSKTCSPPAVRALLGRIDASRSIAPGARFTIVEEKGKGFLLPQLFTHGRLLPTLLLWVMFFMNMLDIYFLNSWLPTLTHGVGLDAEVHAPLRHRHARPHRRGRHRRVLQRRRRRTAGADRQDDRRDGRQARVRGRPPLALGFPPSRCFGLAARSGR